MEGLLPTTFYELFSDNFNRSNAADVSAYTDAFSQANEDPLSSSGAWSVGYNSDGPLAVVGNRVRTTAANITGDLDGVATLAGVSGTRQYVKWTVASINNANPANIASYGVLRAAAPPTRTYYQVGHGQTPSAGSPHVSCFKVVAGTGTQIGSDTAIAGVANGDVFEAIITEHYNIYIYQNGVLVGTFNDTTAAIASGRAGMLVFVHSGGAASDIEIDDFEAGTPPNALLGSDWEEPPPGYHNFSINSGVIQAQIKGDDCRNRVAASGYPGDHWGQITFATLGANGSLGVGLRDQGQDVDTVYDCYTAGTGTAIDRRVAGAATTIASEAVVVWSAGDKMRAGVQGRVIRVWRLPAAGGERQLVLTVGDDQITGGKPAVRGFVGPAGTLTNTQADNWQSGVFVTPYRNLMHPRPFKPGFAR